MTGTLTVDAADASVPLALGGEDRWHVLVLHRGTPVARVELPTPGAAITPALAAAAVHRWADGEIGREQLIERLRARIGQPAEQATPASLRCSVVVCTHRRPRDLAELLAGLARLDPAPHEIVVVDNDPGDHDCQTEALAAGARYVREDRRGLDNARNAGIRASCGDVVAFIDDDCVPSHGWLARLPTEFAHPAVGVVTGPAFPLLLDTPARRRMERKASLARGLQRLEMDWMVFPVAAAGALGVGANMAFRREALERLGPEPFPPELDAGTATESGGDTYVIARMLAAGWRVVYDPATFVYHRHRADGPALHRAVFGYGVGLGAALTRLAVKDRELSVLVTWLWLLQQYRLTQQRRLVGRADSVETRLAWDYVRGGVVGPLRWRRALRDVRRHRSGPDGASDARAAAVAGPRDVLPGSADRGAPLLSVIVPTCGRPQALDCCLAALAAADAGDERFEVVVVDDSPHGDARIAARWTHELLLRRVETHGRGAAAARNAGAAAAVAPLLLFIDDDVVAGPDLLRRHLKRHAECGNDVVVVGSYPPRPVTSSLAAGAAALWWEDLFRALPRAVQPTFVGALTGNMSVSRAAFERSGGFDAGFGRYRREDWEWGVRALGAGLRLNFDEAARGQHRYALDAAGRLRGAELEGHGDGLLLQCHPHAAAPILPLVANPALLHGRRATVEGAAWAVPGAQAAVHAILVALEWGRLRLLWVRLFNAGQRLAYARGARGSGVDLDSVEESVLDVDLESAEPISSCSPAARTVRVRVGGREVARVSPALGQWTPDVARQMVDAAPWEAVQTAAIAAGCWPTRDEAHRHAADTQVIFGPAHDPLDAADSGALRAAGAAVEVVGGPSVQHWQRVAVAARAGEHRLVAITLPGTRPDPRWLDEALVAFDGGRVGAVAGRALADALPLEPLVLHAHRDRDSELLSAAAPQYVILRRELLPALAVELAAVDPVAPILALLEDALQGGWIVGFRDVHGLVGPAPRRFDAARAASVLHVRASPRVRTGATELWRATLIAAWRLARGRGWRAVSTDYAGTLAGLASWRAWRASIPRRFARR